MSMPNAIMAIVVAAAYAINHATATLLALGMSQEMPALMVNQAPREMIVPNANATDPDSMSRDRRMGGRRKADPI